MGQAEEATAGSFVLIDDLLQERLIELTNGSAALCFQCGVCTATCPWGLVKEETVSIRGMIREAQLGLAQPSEQLWLCTTCSQCEALCPRGVHIGDVIRGLRYMAWEKRATPAGLPSVLWSLHWNENPWTQPPSQRFQWAKDLDLPRFDQRHHEILLYVGCTASFDRRIQKVAKAVVRLLRAAGASFGVLGEEEPCCGESALSLGHEPYFEEIARQTGDVFAANGVSHLVTISPHCYDVFENHYPDRANGFYPQHYTEYLAGLIREKRLTIDHPLTQRVTFHDPCYLARRNGQSEAPRFVLKAAGADLTEMEKNGINTLCCGGGGGRMWLETEPGERFSDIRVREAAATGAGTLATACPFCLACLEDSVKALKIEGLEVLDVAEIVQLALVDK